MEELWPSLEITFFVTELEIENGAFYCVYSAKSQLDTAEMKEVASHHKILVMVMHYS